VLSKSGSSGGEGGVLCGESGLAFGSHRFVTSLRQYDEQTCQWNGKIEHRCPHRVEGAKSANDVCAIPGGCTAVEPWPRLAGLAVRMRAIITVLTNNVFIPSSESTHPNRLPV